MKRDIVVELTLSDQEVIAEGLAESARGGAVVHVMIQEDGLKFKMNYGTWTPPLGTVVR